MQDMAVAYLNNLNEEIKKQKDFIAQHQANLDLMESHFTECQEKLESDTSEKLHMLAKPPQVTTKPVEYSSTVGQNQEPSINDQYK